MVTPPWGRGGGASPGRCKTGAGPEGGLLGSLILLLGGSVVEEGRVEPAEALKGLPGSMNGLLAVAKGLLCEGVVGVVGVRGGG